MKLTVRIKDDKIHFEDVRDVCKKGDCIEFSFGNNHIVRLPAKDVEIVYWEEEDCEIAFNERRELVL